MLIVYLRLHKPLVGRRLSMYVTQGVCLDLLCKPSLALEPGPVDCFAHCITAQHEPPNQSSITVLMITKKRAMLAYIRQVQK